jgi:hypothetical protein
MKITQFFGDRERAFNLTPELLTELERKTGTGIGTLCRRVFNSEYHFADLTETIRLALIGAGTGPAEANDRVTAYAANRPVAEILPLVNAILEARFFGPPANQEAAE